MLLLVAVLSAAPIERDARVRVAIDLYESAELMKARDALLELVGAADLSRADHADVRAYLAASYLALADPASARLQMRELAREEPAARPSPARFGPDLIKLA